MGSRDLKGQMEQVLRLADYDPSCNHAFFILIDEYRTPTPEENSEGLEKFRDLRCPVRDGEALQEVLIADYGYRAGNIKTIRNGGATRVAILKQLKWYREKLDETSNLIIFFGGHGEELTEHLQGFWIPHDALQNAEEDYIPNTELKRFFEAMSVRHLLVISDSCYSASLSRSTGKARKEMEETYRTVKVDSSYRRPSRWLLASGHDPVPDGDGKHSPYMHRFLQYFREPDGNEFGCYELGQYLRKAHLPTEPLAEPFYKFARHQSGGQMFFCRQVEVSVPHKVPPRRQTSVVQVEWYYVNEAGNNTGPITEKRMRELIGSGQLQKESEVWSERFEDWQIAGEVSEFKEEWKRVASAQLPVVEVEKIPVPVPPRFKGPRIKSNWTIPETGLEMIWIAPGQFTMGSSEDEEDRVDDEKQHEVELTQGFWLGKYAVTQGEYESVMDNNPSHFKGGGKRLPVEQVSWEEADEFCRKVMETEKKAGRLAEGYEYTLPSEAQWEYACRAGTKGAFGIGRGDRLSSGESNFDGNYPYGGAKKGKYIEGTTEVGSYSPNSWGLYDMHGNVEEWCRDWYEEYPEGRVEDPEGPQMGSNRVYRGGCWYGGAGYCRSAYRDRLGPAARRRYLGFRLALRSIRRRR